MILLWNKKDDRFWFDKPNNLFTDEVLILEIEINENIFNKYFINSKELHKQEFNEKMDKLLK